MTLGTSKPGKASSVASPAPKIPAGLQPDKQGLDAKSIAKGVIEHLEYTLSELPKHVDSEWEPYVSLALAIRDRMVEEAAGITRLLDKLESAGHVVRERSTPDRRQVLCHITPKGESLIVSLDAPVDAANKRASAHLDDEERTHLVELLGAVRASLANHAGERPQGSAREGQPPR